MKYNIPFDRDPSDLVTHAVAQSAVNIVHEIHGCCLVVFSASGKTSKKVSKQRPSHPVYAFTSSAATYNRLSLLWGVTPMYIPDIDSPQRLITSSENLLREKKLIANGDLVVFVIGVGLREGSTNVIKIHRVGHED